MNTNSLHTYLQEISRYPLLSRAEEVQLAKRVEAGDASARRRMTESNLRLVVKIAKSYQGHGVELLDLVQEGTLGLMRAVDRYDWRRGIKFSTYAAWWIRDGITQGLPTAKTIRIPKSVTSRATAIRTVEQQLAGRLGRTPSLAEVGAVLGLSVEEVAEAQAAAQPLSSIHEPSRGEDSEAIELIPDLHAEDPVSELLEHDRQDDLETRLAGLTERGRLVLRLRFGLDGNVEHTGDAVAAKLGITRERVRQIELRALTKLAAEAAREVELPRAA